MSRIRNAIAAPFLCLPLLVGCGGSDPGTGETDAMAELLEQADQLDEIVEAEETRSEIDALTAAAAEARAEADRLAAIEPSDVSNEDMKRGKKIKSSGLLSSSLKAGQEAKNELNILQWQQALQIYTATNNLDPPASEEEFMEKVIEANGITLEPLIEPYEYWYDVEAVALKKRVKQEVIDAAQAAADEAEAALAAAKAAAEG